MKIRQIVIVISLLSIGLPLSAQHRWTLDQCIDTALHNNRMIKQQQLNIERGKIELTQAKFDLLPSLNASASHNFSFGRSLTAKNLYEPSSAYGVSVGISAGLTLFDGLRMKHNIDTKRLSLKETEANTKQIENDIRFNITTVFLQILQNKELLQNSQQQIALTMENIRKREGLIAAGKLAKGENYELEAQLARETLSEVKAKNTLSISLLELAQVMNVARHQVQDIVPPDELVENELSLLSADEIYSQALKQRPEIFVAKYQLERSKKQIDIARTGYYPTLSLGASWGTSYQHLNNIVTNRPFDQQWKNNMGSSIGLSLRVPIFNKFATRSNVKSAQIGYKNAQLAIEDTKLKLYKNVEQAYQNAIAAQQQRATAEKAVTAAEESYRFAQTKYDNGRATPFEVSQAKNSLSQAKSEQIQAKYEYIFKLKVLNYYQQ